MEVDSDIILEGHRRYFSEIPMYQEICSDRKISETKKVGLDLTIEEFEEDPSRILIPIDSFKNYPFDWIMGDHYDKLTKWLSWLTPEKIDIEYGNLHSLDDWITHVERESGVTPIHSSGTSGIMSLIPKTKIDLGIMDVEVNHCLKDILDVKEGTPFFVMSFSEGNLALTQFFKMGSEASTQGNEENQHFLFNRRITPELLRLRAGIYKNLPEKIKGWFIGRLSPMNYKRSMNKFKESLISYKGQDIVMGGPPFMINDLVDKIITENGRLPLGDGSRIICGGGWKSSGAQQIPRDELTKKIGSTFGLSELNILDAYTMAEANWISIECPEHHNKHFSSRMKPVILDDKNKLQHSIYATEGVYEGRLAFFDPSSSYFGFITTGDNVSLDLGGCDCGRSGPVFKPLVKRCEGEGAKGCAAALGRLIGS
ncbi:MAG: hypothetical protein RTV31_01375 [Candidatus Thorarchaeota archaeon]